MFNMLTTCYLFLGGTGAGALVVLCVLKCLRLARLVSLPDDVFERSWAICFVSLATGALCLLADVGRPDRLLVLLSSPVPSVVAVGAFALLAALLLAGGFCLFSWLDLPRVHSAILVVCAGLGIVAGVTTITYTGILLQSMASVLIWQTPLIPFMFVVSSLSCGMGCVFLGTSFVEARYPFMRSFAWIARIDSVLIVLEGIALTLFLVGGMNKDGTSPAAYALLAGDLSWLFWGGLVVFGLVIPFVMERFLRHGNYGTQLLWVAAFLLIGGFVLRYCLVGAAAYDVTQMPGQLYGLAG